MNRSTGGLQRTKVMVLAVALASTVGVSAAFADVDQGEKGGPAASGAPTAESQKVSPYVKANRERAQNAKAARGASPSNTTLHPTKKVPGRGQHK